MKNLSSVRDSRRSCASVIACALVVASAQFAVADPIPYPTSGAYNPVTYTFTAMASGNITAYFAGSTASYVNELGMLVNGVPTGIVGLNNHTSPLGQSLVLGAVNAGDVLTFELINHTLGMVAYSDPSLNVPYDLPGATIHNHVYSTPYTATSPIIDSIPVGTFVSFEDLRFPSSDFNYNDEDFVFTNVRADVPDSASSLALLSIGFAAVGLLGRLLCGEPRKALAS